MIDLNRLETLPPPYEIYEFQAQVPARFAVREWKIGRMNITPRFVGSPGEKAVEAIRLFVEPTTKPHYPPYYDITARRLVHQLAGLLVSGIPPGGLLEIMRDVPGPKAHFSVRWVFL